MILILTALELERQPILRFLENLHTQLHPITGTDYLLGEYKHFQIAVARTDQTNVNAGIETERAITYFKPDYVFFVGIAGGLKDVSIGDIVIGKDVFGYERGKADIVFKSRPTFGFSSYKMERLATNYANDSKWIKKSTSLVSDLFNKKIKVLTGTIASGEKVDASEKSDLHIYLKQSCSHAIAVEMEGLGFLEVGRMYPNIQCLLLRGISDLVENKAASDSEGSQEYASNNVTAFLFGFIDFLSLHSPISFETKGSNVSEIDDLHYILGNLYPEGLSDRNIWSRAGGQLSSIRLNTDAQTQWYNGIDSIKKGMGKTITFKSLLDTVQKDFPNNAVIKNILLNLS
jgi:5'-methylthioadenosine/S-adenosylhomocysteine nucleosidase